MGGGWRWHQNFQYHCIKCSGMTVIETSDRAGQGASKPHYLLFISSAGRHIS